MGVKNTWYDIKDATLLGDVSQFDLITAFDAIERFPYRLITVIRVLRQTAANDAREVRRRRSRHCRVIHPLW